MLFFLAILNFVIGILIGVSGIAGFVLPMTYVGFLHFDPTLSLCLSFLAFIVSGAISTVQYRKKRVLRMDIGKYMALGCIIGSILAVYVSNFLPTKAIKFLMYLIILFSGARLLTKQKESTSSRKGIPAILCFLGILVSLLCTLSGAGGPVILVPLLLNYNLNILESIATSLFLSVFIAVPSFFGYLFLIEPSKVLPWMILIVISHGLGCLLGNRMVDKIKIDQLKKGIGWATVCISVYMIFSMVRS